MRPVLRFLGLVAVASAEPFLRRGREDRGLWYALRQRLADAVTEAAPAPTPQPGPEPDLEGLVARLSEALKPFQHAYQRELALARGDARSEECESQFSDAHNNSFLAGCPTSGCVSGGSLEDTKALCLSTPDCGGVTFNGFNYETRASERLEESPNGETSWRKGTCRHEVPNAVRMLKEFQRALESALLDPTLHLDAEFGPARDDGSIFISVSSYRDSSCPATVRNAFAHADRPDLVNVGVLQQNCMANCYTGIGWDNTRRWVRGQPDPDCIKGFCESEEGRPHCEAGRVRILRLGEAESFGPLFARYLNARMWHGENYFMQIDAHTRFRDGWDTAMVQMMYKTPSFPYSVITYYPPPGVAEDPKPWPRPKRIERRVAHALCGASFERVPDGGWTLRMKHEAATVSGGEYGGTPPYAAFIAAGFFFAHGSLIPKVPPDPFLPYVFMGEEILLSMRFWTSGFDIYSPAIDVVQHEYMRHDHPKFWETVNHVYSDGNIYNQMMDLVMQRVRHIVGFPDAQDPTRVQPPELLWRAANYSAGNVRSRAAYLENVGLDLGRRVQTNPAWCATLEAPPIGRNANGRGMPFIHEHGGIPFVPGFHSHDL